MAVLDASVQIALLNAADEHRQAALAWYTAALTAGEPIHAPWILVAEVGAGITRGLSRPALAREAVARIVGDGAITLFPVDAGLAERAAAVAIEHRVRGCDAIYVALAAILGDTLVTFDAQQSERARAIVSVLTPGAGAGHGGVPRGT